MELQQLRLEYLRLTRRLNIQDNYDALEMYADYLMKIVRVHHTDKVRSVSELEARMINQMMLTKVLHIRQIVNGIKFTSSDGASLNEIIDPTVVAALIRNVYETVSMFNLIFRNTKTKDEKLILYNLWVIAGLNYRQKFRSVISTPENEKKANDEKSQIDKLILEIENTELYRSLEQKEKGKIQKKIDEKDFKISFEGNKVIFLHWQQLCNTMGVEPGLFDGIYTYFSLYAHPSNVAVFQFGGMFDGEDKACWSITIYNLKNLFALLSIFIADYIHLFPTVANIFNQQPLMNQLVINSHNTLLRGYEYSINDSWKKLGLKKD